MSKDELHFISKESYKTLFNDLYPSLCLFANRYLKDLDTSKDVVQDVFIKTWERKVSYPNYNAIKGFLYTSVKNKSLDFLRSKHHKGTIRTLDTDFDKIQTNEHFLSELAIVDIYANLDSAIKTLPNKCEQILRFSLNEYTNNEIAEELSITINTVKSQKRIAYKKLRHSLGSLLNSF
ncbi:RNA polymerase sigma-70 factor [Winogradskyella undariae]|uniref:RNA polymerase sigma-70 factor n=1 Tax=Winogradskyella undariae TaxID=1285465 RepID=UPI00156B13DA|nr:RNA polymerase sigma-70 factor [Winogradskyella undariae]NRR90934.1 RNA polymerase sigma-70 factor [Winogradskyella undariae]